MQCPVEISDKLLDWLEKSHPVYVPKPGDQLDKIFFEAGKQSILTALKNAQEKQLKDRKLA